MEQIVLRTINGKVTGVQSAIIMHLADRRPQTLGRVWRISAPQRPQLLHGSTVLHNGVGILAYRSTRSALERNLGVQEKAFLKGLTNWSASLPFESAADKQTLLQPKSKNYLRH
jgi:hypothetical protein